MSECGAHTIVLRRKHDGLSVVKMSLCRRNDCKYCTSRRAHKHVERMFNAVPHGLFYKLVPDDSVDRIVKAIRGVGAYYWKCKSFGGATTIITSLQVGYEWIPFSFDRADDPYEIINGILTRQRENSRISCTRSSSKASREKSESEWELTKSPIDAKRFKKCMKAGGWRDNGDGTFSPSDESVDLSVIENMVSIIAT